MTTIAWDGKTLAADRAVIQGENVVAYVTKIKRRKDGALIGAAGELCTAQEYVRWFLAGEKKKNKPGLKAKASENYSASVIIVRPNGKVEVHDQDGWHELEGVYTAIGSGTLPALVAMRLGKTAEEAVKIAAEFDINTDSYTDTLHYGNTP